jgi:hypothetical protein
VPSAVVATWGLPSATQHAIAAAERHAPTRRDEAAVARRHLLGFVEVADGRVSRVHCSIKVMLSPSEHASPPTTETC